jgi:hypothetical protein
VELERAVGMAGEEGGGQLEQTPFIVIYILGIGRLAYVEPGGINTENTVRTSGKRASER